MEIRHLDKTSESQKRIEEFIEAYEYLLPDPFSAHVNLKEYSSKLNALGETFVIEDNGDIVALGSGYINDTEKKEAYYQILIIREEYQGNGYASALTHSFFNYAKNKFGTGKVYLTVDKSNINAYKKYLHLGFVESERVHPNNSKQIMVYKF